MIDVFEISIASSRDSLMYKNVECLQFLELFVDQCQQLQL